MTKILDTGLSDVTIANLKRVFSESSTISKVILYGSRAKGTYRAGSDIDLTLKGKNISTDELLKIEQKIDDLLLPYKVDLSIYDKLDNSEFIEHIDRVGKILYAKDS